MGKIRYGGFLKEGIIGLLQKIVITVLVVLALTFLLSLFLKTRYKVTLKYSTIAIAVIGGLSVLGGTNKSQRYNANYYYDPSISTNNSTGFGQDLLKSSLGFCILMGVSAGLLYLIYLLL